MAKKGNYVCESCGKDCGNPPALELHKKYCKGKVQKSSKCEHDFRLLDPKSIAENKALQDGYLQVCNKCQELE